MIEAILGVLAPFVTKWITSAVKWFTVGEKGQETARFFDTPLRKSFLRIVTATLAVLTAMLTFWLDGSTIDPSVIDVLTESVKNFLGATGVYLLTKKQG